MINSNWSDAEKARECRRLAEENEGLFDLGKKQATEKWGADGSYRWAKTVQAQTFLKNNQWYIAQAAMYASLAVLDSQEARQGVVRRIPRTLAA